MAQILLLVYTRRGVLHVFSNSGQQTFVFDLENTRKSISFAWTLLFFQSHLR